VRLVEYSPEYFGALNRAASQFGSKLALTHRPFVDYYYAGQDWCKLYLFLADDGSVVATIGVDRMRFEYASREVIIGFASNFYAFQHGAGGYLFMHWMKVCPTGLVLGGTQHTHRIIRAQKWTYFTGIKTYSLNKPYDVEPGEVWWRVVAKSVLRRLRRVDIWKCPLPAAPENGAEISVREERAYNDDLLPAHSPFIFRFAPTIDYLRWRYRLDLSFTCYRLFRVLANDTTLGYVIINETPKKIIVAHCDGEDAKALAYGVLSSVLQVAREDSNPRMVLLTSSHQEMRRVYERSGFRADRRELQFALGALRRQVDFASDTSKWLISYGWGDNDLLGPFRDETVARTSTSVIHTA
jgi:hypothetical protein